MWQRKITPMTDAPTDKDGKDYQKLYERMLTEDLVKRLIALERKVSDDRYAIKLVEKIVFAQVGLALLAVVGGLLSLVVIK